MMVKKTIVFTFNRERQDVRINNIHPHLCGRKRLGV